MRVVHSIYRVSRMLFDIGLFVRKVICRFDNHVHLKLSACTSKVHKTVCAHNTTRKTGKDDSISYLCDTKRRSAILPFTPSSGSSMADVEEELWNIFTFYTLRGNHLDLTRLSVRTVLQHGIQTSRVHFTSFHIMMSTLYE